VFAGVFVLGFYTTNLNDTSATSTGVPTEFRDLLSADQRTLLDGLVKLEADPNDPEALKNVANAFYNLRDQTGNVQYAQKAIEYYERYLKLRPDDQDVRTDLAAMYFYAGATDRAIQTATQVIEASPDHVQANFNLGIFYWRGRNDYQAAALQFKKVVDLTQNGDSHTQLINDQARSNIATIIKEADAAGQPLDVKALGLDGLDGGTI